MLDYIVERQMIKVVREEAKKHGVSPESLTARGRWEPLSTARKEAIWRCHSELKVGTLLIGKFFNRDQATITSALKHRKVIRVKN